MAEPRCPICNRPSDPALRPFCSRRCADIDFGRWLTGRYVIPAPPPAADGSETEDE